jgi:hypothetical protein
VTWEPNCSIPVNPFQVTAPPGLAHLVRTWIAVDLVEGLAEVVGQGSAAVMVWVPAWISMAR